MACFSCVVASSRPTCTTFLDLSQALVVWLFCLRSHDSTHASMGKKRCHCRFALDNETDTQYSEMIRRKKQWAGKCEKESRDIHVYLHEAWEHSSLFTNRMRHPKIIHCAFTLITSLFVCTGRVDVCVIFYSLLKICYPYDTHFTNDGSMQISSPIHNKWLAYVRWGSLLPSTFIIHFINKPGKYCTSNMIQKEKALHHHRVSTLLRKKPKAHFLSLFFPLFSFLTSDYSIFSLSKLIYLSFFHTFVSLYIHFCYTVWHERCCVWTLLFSRNSLQH